MRLAELAQWLQRRPSAALAPGAAARRRVDLIFIAAVVVTLAVGLLAVLWLVGKANQISSAKDRSAAQADAVKTGAAIALGTGGAAYLLLAYRRHRLEEVDTLERRITELYTKAVEQLGHAQAPVRLGALYSLERLAQANIEYRQTIVDVLCAYLRMPFTTQDQSRRADPAEPVDKKRSSAEPSGDQVRDSLQELQVRKTAQRILANHLRRPMATIGIDAHKHRPSPSKIFWPNISLDLTGATLSDFKLEDASVAQVRFDGATFGGNTLFGRAAFGDAEFSGTTFGGDALFNQTTFSSDVSFDGAIFGSTNSFPPPRAKFGGAIFLGRASFRETRFHANAEFDEVTFTGPAAFHRAVFNSSVEFNDTTFHEGIWFHRTVFDGVTTPEFRRVTFTREAWFGETNGYPDFTGAHVLNLQNPQQRAWGDQWSICPDPKDPSAGWLINEEVAEKDE